MNWSFLGVQRMLSTATFAVFTFATSAFSGGPETRLQSERPDAGRFVLTDHGYMLPYQQPIPGSNAVIEMQPVAAGNVVLPPLPSDAPSGEPSTAAVSAFWIGKYEITMDQYLPYRRLYYQQKKEALHRVHPEPKLSDVDAVTGPTEVYEPSYNFEYSGVGDSPVPCVSQFAARQYTKFISLLTEQEYRLPLRSEWQHACLAGNVSTYCFGNDPALLSRYAVCFHDDHVFSIPLRVGQKKPNEWGLFDMHGNLSEWVIEDSAKFGMRHGHVACGGNADSSAEQCAASAVIRTTEEWWDEDPDFPRSPWWMTSEQSRLTGFRIIAPLMPMSAEEKATYWDADSPDLTVDVQSRLDSGRGSLGRVGPPKPTTRTVDVDPPAR